MRGPFSNNVIEFFMEFNSQKMDQIKLQLCKIFISTRKLNYLASSVLEVSSLEKDFVKTIIYKNCLKILKVWKHCTMGKIAGSCRHCYFIQPFVQYTGSFFIESGKVICYKKLKISLSHVIFGLRTEVIMGHLKSDHFKMHF